MSIHALSFEDEDGSLEDIAYTCSQMCQVELMRTSGVPEEDIEKQAQGLAGSCPGFSYGKMPGGEETDFDVNCANCGDLLWHGLQTPEKDEEPEDDEDEMHEASRKIIKGLSDAGISRIASILKTKDL